MAGGSESEKNKVFGILEQQGHKLSGEAKHVGNVLKQAVSPDGHHGSSNKDKEHHHDESYKPLVGAGEKWKQKSEHHKD
ncbi:uncharacterized protein KNAG_0F01790 [Huiozyma naganishii CBS 8797]|uniref:Uncharacterized protein n=1 Tax=Huiozyma naganishii (strain ATCC MYA-139 / BCRC 22969 / CBS 8797 / KCTC 17520 / NBRC 10181 / NCYC 3082 / Yp74L-3) TaxID=1071383 RepID=J7S007_HUIN7|nr:hypothetical protein KNAG_0F01790 [Kazachstania naganishii CBS 8797]CCK70847.1 hypothetical protein KNAG_0F01790 [Kazachstania naganishii CBS 8797]